MYSPTINLYSSPSQSSWTPNQVDMVTFTWKDLGLEYLQPYGCFLLLSYHLDYQNNQIHKEKIAKFPWHIGSQLNIHAKTVDPVIEGGAQVQQILNIECLSGFTDTPVLNVQFRLALELTDTWLKPRC